MSWAAEISSGMRRRDTRALARLLTAIENQSGEASALLRRSRQSGKPALRIGITGPAGCGKSTLIDRLIERFRAQKKTVGVLAVDPSSPITGGALLGDRIRMQRHARDKGVFVRSMAGRGALGGLSPALPQAILAMEMFGFDVLLMETVGAGQGDTAMRGLCDVLLVLSPPEAVDTVQAMKAGLMEIADVFVVHKADLPGADHAIKVFQEILSLSHKKTPVVAVSSLKNSGYEELMKALEFPSGVVVSQSRSPLRTLSALRRFGPSAIVAAVSKTPQRSKGARSFPTGFAKQQHHSLTHDHVAIAVHKIKDHLPLYRDLLGIELEGTYDFKEYGVRIAAFALPNGRLELLEPLGKKSTLAKFLAKRGEGLHHLAFRTHAIEKQVKDLKKAGLSWINEKPRRGLHDTRVCFLHPRSSKGILLEFVE